jgi:hypothetical protein
VIEDSSGGEAEITLIFRSLVGSQFTVSQLALLSLCTFLSFWSGAVSNRLQAAMKFLKGLKLGTLSFSQLGLALILTILSLSVREGSPSFPLPASTSTDNSGVGSDGTCVKEVDEALEPKCKVTFREEGGWPYVFNATCIKPNVFLVPHDRPLQGKISTIFTNHFYKN